jgi:hypothetical protein
LASAVVIWIIEGIVSMNRQMKNDPPGGKRQGNPIAGAPPRRQGDIPNLKVATAPADQQ